MRSEDPKEVPPIVKVHVGELGPALALAAKKNNRTLSAEIRARLERSLEMDQQNSEPISH